MSRGCAVTVKGMRFSSSHAALSYHRISPATWYKYHKIGMTVDDVVTMIENRVTDYQGNSFRSFAELCRFHGVKYFTFMDRLKKGYSIEDCLKQKDFRKERCTSVRQELTQ